MYRQENRFSDCKMTRVQHRIKAAEIRMMGMSHAGRSREGTAKDDETQEPGTQVGSVTDPFAWVDAHHLEHPRHSLMLTLINYGAIQVHRLIYERKQHHNWCLTRFTCHLG